MHLHTRQTTMTLAGHTFARCSTAPLPSFSLITALLPQ
jgi:hypothetical protein